MECPLGYKKKISSEEKTTELSRDRKESPIPTKDGGHWIYPSPAQFYAATKAKGHEVAQDQVPVIVDIHNAVNDEAWHRISKMEKKLNPTCTDVRLVRFVGRPGDRSLKSEIMEKLFGWTKPFDRHDWLIDRCGQANKRYIVDFYDGKPLATRPDLVPVFIDARPAVDGVKGLWERLKLLLI